MLRIHRAFNLTPEQVTIRRVPSARKQIPQVEAAIENAWTKAMQRPGIHLFDGPMCRLESWSATDDSLDLTLSPSSYKSFLGTNMSHPEFFNIHGPQVMANPIGVSPALHTADNFLILGKRNSTMAYYPSRIHPFSGCMEPDDTDLFTTVRRELSEELTFKEPDILDIRLTGIVEDLNLHQAEFIFAVSSNRTRAHIESQMDKIEHQNTWGIPATASAIEQAITTKELTPVAVAVLTLWGRLQFGQDWFNRVVARALSG